MTDTPATTPVCPRCGYQTDGFICTKCATPQTTDPLDMELPCAIEFPGVRFGKGVKLRTLVSAARRWKRMADELVDIQHPISSKRALDVFLGKGSATDGE